MAGASASLSSDLQEVIQSLEFDDDLRKKLTDTLAESEGRFDLWSRSSDFGSVVRHRRRKPRLYTADGAKIAAAHISAKAPLPVKSGRVVAGWNWKIKGLNAKVVNQVPYAEHARKTKEPVGAGAAKVEEWIVDDWSDVAEKMADHVAAFLGQEDLT